KEAQDICSGLTSMLLEENLKLREAVAQNTTAFLSRQLEQAKRDIDDQDSKLATFKKQYMGQLPGDEENNLKILMGLNSQLDANTQSLNRAQQDKSYTESLLAQQLAAWKSTQSATNPQTLEQNRAYKGRVALSPAVEEQYKLLTRDYDTAQRFYNDLLAKKSQSAMQTDMERGQQGEQMRLLNPANLPDAPSFPNRWLFTG